MTQITRSHNNQVYYIKIWNIIKQLYLFRVYPFSFDLVEDLLMNNRQPTNSTRRYRAYVSSLGTTKLHARDPYVIAWWSAALPGLGHLLLSKYLRGFLLFIWEIFINVNAHINLAIMYSFCLFFRHIFCLRKSR